MIARYDTTDDEALAAGVATGCRGVVEVFIERLDGRAVGPLGWMGLAIAERRTCAIATVVRAAFEGSVREGARLSVSDDGGVEGDIEESELRRSIVNLLGAAPAPFEARVLEIGDVEVFVELVAPPQAVVIFGGGPDVVPVVQMAKVLGWDVTVVASRPATGLRERFAQADQFLVTSSEDPTADVCIAADAAVVLMTHNFPRDVRILAGLRCEPRYLGILGPRLRTGQLLDEVGSIGHWDVRAPIGVDVGAESPEEIALAIVAEIQSVVRGASAGFLRDRSGPIHERAELEEDRPSSVGDHVRGPTCSM
jgi:xanthine dehydrogenase accessory factor